MKRPGGHKDIGDVVRGLPFLPLPTCIDMSRYNPFLARNRFRLPKFRSCLMTNSLIVRALSRVQGAIDRIPHRHLFPAAEPLHCTGRQAQFCSRLSFVTKGPVPISSSAPQKEVIVVDGFFVLFTADGGDVESHKGFGIRDCRLNSL